MARLFSVLVFAVAIGLAVGARAQSILDGRARDRLDYAPIVLHVACGEVFRPPCAKVLPRIAAWTLQAGVDLKPVESGGAIDTAAAVCQGQTAVAIVQRDAIALIGQQAACLGRYDVVGRSLYPYYAFLVVKADAPFRSLADLASGGPDGPGRTIAAGAENFGGQVTFSFLLRAHPAWQRAITVTNDNLDTALERIATGSIDGFFAMETLDSGAIDRIRLKSDARGKPIYTFIDVRPENAFFRTGDGGGHCLYRLTALDFGGLSPVTTVSVDAVMMLGRGFRDTHARGGPPAPDVLALAIEQTQAAILTDMKSPRDWRPAGTSCH